MLKKSKGQDPPIWSPPEQPITKILKTNIGYLQKELSNCCDLILRPFKIGVDSSTEAYVIYLDYLVDSAALQDNQKAGTTMLLIILAIGIGGLLTEAAYTMVFGLERSFLTLPFYFMSRYASIGSVIERMDPFFMISNFLGNFLKLSIFTYVIVLGLAQLFKMKNYRSLIIPVILALNITGYYSFRSMMEVIDFTDKIWPFFTLPIQIGIPLLLIIVAKVRGLGNNKKSL